MPFDYTISETEQEINVTARGPEEAMLPGFAE
jgi:hypothetical protein